MREPTRTEIDGVPVVWVDVPGPLRAALHFRVGVANETAPTHGITHLVEHLALFGMHDRPYALNGSVDLTRTMFVAAGTPEELAEYFGSVCARLGDLPAERVEVERGVLKAEFAGRSAAYRDLLLYWRYGARAHGLAGVREYGLNWLDAATVRAWAADRFTRANALLTLTGPPPPGLRLPLADGPAHPPLTAETVEAVIPGWTAVNAAGLAMGAEIPRASAATTAAALLDSELNRVLRFERGLTYSVASCYEPVAAELAHVVFSADADDAKHEELRDGFLDVLERLAREGPDQATFDMVTARRDRMDDEDRLLGLLSAAGSDFALGRPVESFTSISERIAAVTRDDVTESLRAMADSAMFVTPHPVRIERADLPELPQWSAGTVVGQPYRGVTAEGSLVVGDEGVSIVRDGNAVTVRWPDAVAALWWDDGARVILGRDGFRVIVVPADWADGAAAVARIDALTPRGLTVPMGESGPQPYDSGEVPPPAPPATRPIFLKIGNAVLYMMGISVLAAGLSGPEPATATTEEFTRGDAIFSVVLGIALLAGAAYWTYRQVRAARAARA